MTECSRKVLAQALLEWTLGSTTTFLEAKDNQDLVDKAKKLGIELPSPDLAAFETIYCELDKFNRNKVKISKKAAEKGIKTLIGKQCNWNHSGANQICGYIIDANIKKDKIYITGILFKSLFKSEFGEVKQLFADGKLFVSFELWNRNENGDSIVRTLGNGFRELSEFIAHGCALLLIDQETGEPIPPACPNAQVQQLLASEKVIKEAEQIANSVFEKDKNLVYAELAITKEEFEPCSNCSCEEGGKDNIMADEIKKEEVVKDEVVKEIEKSSEETSELKTEVKPEEEQTEKAQEVEKKEEVVAPVSEEVKVEETEKAEVAEPEETKTEELKVEETKEIETPEPEKAQEKVEATPKETEEKLDATPKENKEEATKTVTKTEETQEFKKEGDKDVLIQDVKKESVTTDDEGKEIQKVEIEYKEKVSYTMAQVEEIKATYEVKLKEKDTEIAKLKKELDDINQEIEKVKLEEAKKEEETPEVTVGDVQPTSDKYKQIQREIDTKAFGERKR